MQQQGLINPEPPDRAAEATLPLGRPLTQSDIALFRFAAANRDRGTLTLETRRELAAYRAAVKRARLSAHPLQL